MADSTKAKRVNFMQVLPPELRLIILEFAYAVPTARPLIAKGEFGEKHRELNNVGVVGATTGPFVYGVDKFLVSREFFIDAAKAYGQSNAMASKLSIQDHPSQIVIAHANKQPVHAPRAVRGIVETKLSRNNPFTAATLRWEAHPTQELLWQVPGATMSSVFATHQHINQSIGRAIAVDPNVAKSGMTGNDVAAKMGMSGDQLYAYIKQLQQERPDIDNEH